MIGVSGISWPSGWDTLKDYLLLTVVLEHMAANPGFHRSRDLVMLPTKNGATPPTFGCRKIATNLGRYFTPRGLSAKLARLARDPFNIVRSDTVSGSRAWAVEAEVYDQLLGLADVPLSTGSALARQKAQS